MELTANGMNGQVHFDGRFVTIERKGLLAKSTIGGGAKRIPVKSVTAVQWKAPTKLIHGFIEFTIAGGVESRSRSGRQKSAAAKNENAVVVKYAQLEEFEAIRAAIEDAIA